VSLYGDTVPLIMTSRNCTFSYRETTVCKN